MAWQKNVPTTKGCDSSSHGILSSGSPKRNVKSMAIHFRNSQKDSVSSSTSWAQS